MYLPRPNYSIVDKMKEYDLGPSVCHKRQEVMEVRPLAGFDESGIKIIIGTGKFEMVECKLTDITK